MSWLIKCFTFIQDYPSISQVAVKAKEKNVNIIFAVTADQKPIYDQLKPIIAGSETGVLASDSQNIVKLVRDNYLVRNIIHIQILVYSNGTQ